MLQKLSSAHGKQSKGRSLDPCVVDVKTSVVHGHGMSTDPGDGEPMDQHDAPPGARDDGGDDERSLDPKQGRALDLARADRNASLSGGGG